MPKSVISSEELCNFFLNGFINGYIPQDKITSNVQDIDIENEGDYIKIATWKLGFIAGNQANTWRLN